VTEYPTLILSISLLFELLLIFILFSKYLELKKQFNQLLKNHGILMRAARREGLINGEDLQ